MPPRSHRYREEVINVQLATILCASGLDANPETIQSGNLPDVLILLEGLKLVLEGRSTSLRASLMRDAKKRVEEGLADISMAILYPDALYTAPSIAAMSRKIEESRYDGAIFFMSSSGLRSIPFEGASLNEFVQTINNAFHLRLQNDVVREQVLQLEETIEKVVSDASATNLFFSSDALVVRLKQALGIGGDEGANEIPD